MIRKLRKPWTRNRDIARRPRTGKVWCNGCDMRLIGPGQRCPLCGFRERRVLKKETNA